MLPHRPRVFISYQRTDNDVARRVREQLRANGITTWMDQFDIPIGAYWSNEIDQALAGADTVVGILSPDAVASRNVKNEWDWAIANGRRLILVQVASSVLSHRYVAINLIDATGPDLESALAELLRSLGVVGGEQFDAAARMALASEDHTCPACGARRAETARFCGSCGSLLPHAAFVSVSVGESQTPVSFVGGRYTVTRFLGEGATRRVYACHDTALDRDVAFALLKTQGLDVAGIESMMRAAQALGHLGDHPAIVTIYDLNEDRGQPYLVSELIDGGDLEGLLAQAPDHRLPLEQVLRIADQLLQALAHAHQHGVVHCDLRPGNIWFTSGGNAKLGDFGLAHAINTTRRASSGMFAGTASYLSPEQALGRPMDPRSDLYSFGALLYEMVAGRPPFQADDPLAVISQHINIAPVAPSWHNPYVPRPLEDLIMQLLAKDPADRPTSAEAVRQVLAGVSVLGGSPYRAELRDDRVAANPLDRVAGGIFVGREQELGQLRRAVDAALGGRAGIALLAGEPGIGKTTLAEEAVTYARVRGAQALWGRCYEWEGAPAYWPWVQIIRGYVQQVDPQRLRAEMGTGAADIAQVVPELRERIPELPEPPRLDGEQARFRLFDSFARFLQAATNHDPMLLVLDDLHWADTPSLLLLQFVARELEQTRLHIIGTYRDVEIGRRHPLTTTLAELSRGHATERIAIRGLEPADTGRLIALSAGIEPEPGLVDAVQRETEGNPFFASEIVRLLVAEGRLGRTSGAQTWSVSIPQSVRDVVGRRLGRLSAECNDVLAIASVIGRDFTLPVLERASGLPVETLYDALDEAVRARLLHEKTPDERFRFTHALVQDTLYDEIGRGRRLRLHAAVGQALERVHGADLEPHYAILAYHFDLAAPAGNSDVAVGYAIKAGDQAMTRFAWESAIQHFERALHAVDMRADPNAVQRCDILLALGSAQSHSVVDMSESPGGQSVFLQAAEIAKEIGSYERLARAAIGYAGVSFARMPGGLQQVQLLEDALALAPKVDSAITARLLARLATDYRVIPDRHERVKELSDAAIAMARRLGDPLVLAYVLIARRTAFSGPDDLDERLAITDEARRAAEVAGDLHGRYWSNMLGSSDLYEAGDNQGLERAWDSEREIARMLRMPFYQLGVDLAQTSRALKDGRYADAESSVQMVGGDSQALVARYLRTLLLFQLRREQGRLQEVDALLRSIIDLTNDDSNPFDRHRGRLIQVLHTIVLAESGQLDDARAQFEICTGGDLGHLPKDTYWLTTVALLADVSMVLAERKHAATLYALLLPYADRNAVAGSGNALFGSVSYYLGLLATLLSRWQDAVRHFDEALVMNARMRARPAVARTQYAYATMLLKRARPKDRERVRELLDQSLATAHELGMLSLIEQAQIPLAAIESTTGSPRTGQPISHGLSPRELEVLRLIVAGNTDREIAEALFISPRTVTTHVGNIFNKLGLKTRAEAAAFAVRCEFV